MADEEAAFEILGKIEVDVAALKKSLGEAEGEVRKYASKHREIMESITKPLPGGGFSEGGPGGEGPGGGGGESGARHSPTAEFAHMARVVRHDLVPALSRLSPQLAEFISAGAQSARTAVFFGGAIGAVAIAGAIVSEVIGKYIDKAKEMAAANMEAARSIETWDFARVVSGIKRVNESVTAYAENVKTLGEGPGGKAGFWGWLVAATEVAVEKITGGLDHMVEKYKVAAEAAAKIGKEFELPKSVIELDKERAQILVEQAESAKKNAVSNTELAAAYEKVRSAQEGLRDEGIALLRLDEEKAQREIDPEKMKAALQDQLRRQKTAMEEAKKINALGGLSDMMGGQSQADASRLKSATDAVKKTEEQIKSVYDDSNALKAQIAEKFENKVIALREKTAQKLRASYYEEAMSYLHSREAMASEANQAILESETKIEEIRRKQMSTTESANQFEVRMTKTRENAIGPIEAAIAAETEMYAKRQEQLAAAKRIASEEEDPKKRADMLKQAKMNEEAIEQGHVAASEDLNRKLNTTKAKQDAEYAAGRMRQMQDEVAEEERLFGHRVKMGQQTMQAEQEMQEAAARDPRRTIAQQQSAEEKALAMKKQYAEEYFKFYQSMGVNTWAAELATHQQFLSQTVSGSKEWFTEVDKTAKLYENIHSAAKGIVSSIGSAAEAEAKRQGKMIRNPQDLQRFAWDAERRDAETLRGGGKRPGEYLSAVGRNDMWRQGRQQFGDVGTALGFALANPQQQLANTVAATSTRPDIYGRAGEGADAAKQAAINLKDLAEAAAMAADRLRNIGDRPGDTPANQRPPAEDATKSMGPSYRVLQTADGPLYTNVPPGQDSAMGRSLALAGKRGPNP